MDEWWCRHVWPVYWRGALNHSSTYRPLLGLFAGLLLADCGGGGGSSTPAALPSDHGAIVVKDAPHRLCLIELVDYRDHPANALRRSDGRVINPVVGSKCDMHRGVSDTRRDDGDGDALRLKVRAERLQAHIHGRLAHAVVVRALRLVGSARDGSHPPARHRHNLLLLAGNDVVAESL